jgi:hypothetical protein
MLEISLVVKDGVQYPAEKPPDGYIYAYCTGQKWRYYFPGEEALIPAIAPSSPEPDWSKFRLSLLSDAGIDRLGAQDHTQFAKVVGCVTMDPLNVDALVIVWNKLIDATTLLSKATTAEVAAWNAIATASNVPIKFLSTGKIEKI